MFGQLALTAAALFPLTLAAPTPSVQKRSSQLSCVQFQYEYPWTSFGFNGMIHLYSNITMNHPETQTLSFNESRLGVSADGTIQPCGDCRTTELFGFEVCQGPDGQGSGGLGNSATSFYGHINYQNPQTLGSAKKCVAASSSSNYNGSTLILADCQYDYDTVASSGQYFQMSTSDGSTVGLLLNEQGSPSYGPNPHLDDGAPLSLYDGPANGPFTYFGFKAQQF